MFPSKINVKALLQKAGKKNLMIAAGVAGCLALGGLGTTLAANINLNGGSVVEFGQGVVQTAACDHEVLVTPNSTFVNGTPGEFKFSSVTLSNLDSTDSVEGSVEGCQGKTFSIRMYKENGDLISRSYFISVGTGSFSSGDGTITSSNAGASDSSVTLTFRNLDVAASDVHLITIQSSKLIGGLWAVQDGGHLFQINTQNGGDNVDVGMLHDIDDTNNPTRPIGFDYDPGWGFSGMAYNQVDGKMYVLIGKCCNETKKIYKFTLPSGGDSSSIIQVSLVGVIDSANNGGMDWRNYGLRGMAIDSQGHISIAVHNGSGNNQYAQILQVSATDASVVNQIDLNADTSDSSHGIYTSSDKHAYGIAFDNNDKLWFSARLANINQSPNFWVVNDGPQTWRGLLQPSNDPNGNLTIDPNGLVWMSDWNDYLYSFDPNGQSPGDLSGSRRGRLPNNVFALAWVR